MFQPREYRHWVQTHGLVAYTVQIRETDLYIRTCTDLSVRAFESVKRHREALEQYILSHPFFAASFEPIDVTSDAPFIVREMVRASALAGVGPMAAVAGTMAQMVGKDLAMLSKEVIIENGGDNYIRSENDRVVSIYAGNSPLSGKVGLLVKATDTPLGICTSSGTVGPSISLGKADAAVVVAASAALADAAATAVGNAIITAGDIPHALEIAQSIEGLVGVVIIKDARMGVWGKLEICATDSRPDEWN
jgi:ApbE superfamily uncharacterized protein (UPF0280 family)